MVATLQVGWSREGVAGYVREPPEQDFRDVRLVSGWTIAPLVLVEPQVVYLVRLAPGGVPEFGEGAANVGGWGREEIVDVGTVAPQVARKCHLGHLPIRRE